MKTYNFYWIKYQEKAITAATVLRAETPEKACKVFIQKYPKRTVLGTKIIPKR